MGKQSSNKKYSFKGQRIIGDDKSKLSKSKLSSESEGSTTDDMMSVLESDVHISNNKMHNLGNLANLSNLPNQQMDMSQMDMSQMGMSQMGMSQMGMPQMGMPQMDMPQMNMPQMNMPQMGMPQMNMPQMNMPQMMGSNNDIDSLMVNTMVPMNNASMNFNSNHLMNSSQMANNLGSLAKLSNFNSAQMPNQMNQELNNSLNFKNLSKLNM